MCAPTTRLILFSDPDWRATHIAPNPKNGEYDALDIPQGDKTKREKNRVRAQFSLI